MTEKIQPTKFTRLPNGSWVSPSHVTGIVIQREKEFVTSTVPPRVVIFLADRVETINVESIEEAEIMANKLVEMLSV